MSTENTEQLKFFIHLTIRKEDPVNAAAVTNAIRAEGGVQSAIGFRFHNQGRS